ncbi:DUF2252 domain-containing protein [Conyzicola nivalis]|uniref:DUF2252 domain-containing protein n=2 Tax=Conyzicola nivalis TaxID=1477021 RepID=A0A916WG37_9MICO|nr:hypothetical protein GCM10010979_10030 [Conyzicola nivalis]
MAERAALGRTARKSAPRAEHAHWAPAADRLDPVAILEDQATTRVPELVPIRHGRMLASPFAFYRGAAAIMAGDLDGTPDSGLTVQLCGDAHLSNFGLFASPERAHIFDINDFDETLPGPWEWDVKRLAASFDVAGRHRGFSRPERRQLAQTVARGYRERMRGSATSRVLAAWYDRVDADQLFELLRRAHTENRLKKDQVDRLGVGVAKARLRDSARAFRKLVYVVDGELRIRPQPPLIVPLADLGPAGRTRSDDEETVREILLGYRSTVLQPNHPLRDFEFVDMARKVVGVGSVGTRSWVVLLRGRDNLDPLLLQAKQAEHSVLEKYLPPSEYEHHGERVVRGQRIMQSASDIFLGWERVEGFDGVSRDFYIRQLTDWKGSVDVDVMQYPVALLYARLCGETLARAHARSGDRMAIAGYLGGSDTFDRAIARFSERYADQNDLDFDAFREAVASGRIHADTDH